MRVTICTHCHEGVNAWQDPESGVYHEDECQMCTRQGMRWASNHYGTITHIPMSKDLEEAIHKVLANVKSGKPPLSR